MWLNDEYYEFSDLFWSLIAYAIICVLMYGIGMGMHAMVEWFSAINIL